MRQAAITKYGVRPLACTERYTCPLCLRRCPNAGALATHRRFQHPAAAREKQGSPLWRWAAGAASSSAGQQSAEASPVVQWAAGAASSSAGQQSAEASPVVQWAAGAASDSAGQQSVEPFRIGEPFWIRKKLIRSEGLPAGLSSSAGAGPAGPGPGVKLRKDGLPDGRASNRGAAKRRRRSVREKGAIYRQRQ